MVLDGVSGEVHLAGRTGGELRRDLLASDLPALAGLIRETEAVARAAEQRDPGDGRRGAGVVAAVMGIAEQRMREVDPGLFRAAAENPPAHWGTALLVASLAWGALPGTEADGLAYEFGADLVEELAALTDEGLVRRYRPEELPAALVHEPTRRLLTDVGLPLGGEMFGVEERAPLVSMAEAHPDCFRDADEGRRSAGTRATTSRSAGGPTTSQSPWTAPAAGWSCRPGTTRACPPPTSTGTCPRCCTRSGRTSGCAASGGAGTTGAGTPPGRCSIPT